MELSPYEECRDTGHLETFFQDVIDKAGEGIILRDPAELYTPGRAPGFLKHKVLCRTAVLSNLLTEIQRRGGKGGGSRRGFPVGVRIVRYTSHFL